MIFLHKYRLSEYALFINFFYLKNNFWQKINVFKKVSDMSTNFESAHYFSADTQFDLWQKSKLLKKYPFF